MNKMNEIVYAVPRKKLFDNDLLFSGMISAKDDLYLFKHLFSNMAEHCCQMTRGECETNFDFKHLIPYVVLKTDDGQFFTAKRTKNQTEKRLHNKLSIGIGGHIGPAFETMPNKDLSFAESIDLGMRRELLEELLIYPDTFDHASIPMFEIIKPKLVGILNDDSNPVGLVHLGLIYFANIKTQDIHRIGIRETENMTSNWHTFKELQYMTNFESWSEIIINSGLINDPCNNKNEREEKLWMAVLERAVMDLSHSDILIRKDAEAWFKNRTYDQANSFIGICKEFRLNPFYVSEFILENHKKIGFKLRNIYENSKAFGYQRNSSKRER